jgi:hypothetical protein
MTTTTQQATIPDTLRLGAAHVTVSDLERALYFASTNHRTRRRLQNAGA